MTTSNTTRQIFIHNKPYRLDTNQLIQAGGEGMVFRLENTAVKIYHQPTNTQRQKLQHLCQNRLLSRLPAHVLGPRALVEDDQQQVVGLQMPRLPQGTEPIKRLASPAFWQKQGIQTSSVVVLLQQILATLTQLHQLNIIVGDLNDGNIFFQANDPALPAHFWIDVDSFQFGRFPCPVAMHAFLDPNLYHVADFSRQPAFTPLTDWYAFTVLLVRSLLQVHPYGGTHHQYKTLAARAQANASILHPAVTYPKRARPLDALSDDLLHTLQQTFEQGRRRPFPSHLLTEYAQTLVTCRRCGLAYPHSRPGCPACRTQTAAPTPPTNQGLRTLLTTDGFIAKVACRPDGRFLVIVRCGDRYRLIKVGLGGIVSEMDLFSGQPGYRFALFAGHLVVNPPHRPQLLLLDVRRDLPQRVTLLETALFRESAVFAATPQALYRITGGWIMRGIVTENGFLEEAVSTAHRDQTQFRASPYHDTIAGFHRRFAEYHFFALVTNKRNERQNLSLSVPPPLPGQHLNQVDVMVSVNSIAVLRQLQENGRYPGAIDVFDLQGKWVRHDQVSEPEWALSRRQYPFQTRLSGFPYRPLPPPFSISEEANLYQHRQGLLIQETTQLRFLPQK